MYQKCLETDTTGIPCGRPSGEATLLSPQLFGEATLLSLPALAKPSSEAARVPLPRWGEASRRATPGGTRREFGRRWNAVPGILLIARLFVSRAGGHQSPQSPTYEQAGERSMEFFLLLFLTSGPKGARARHRAVVRYAFVDASVASVPWPKGHGGRLGASTLFRRHARYRLDLGVARVRAGFSRRANYLPPGQGCHRPSGKQRHGTMPGKETAI